MSDATHPDMNPSHSPSDDSLHPVDSSHDPIEEIPQAEDEAWQTVNFPGALDVDDIPMEAAIVQPVSAANQISVSFSGMGQVDDRDGLVQQLQQENTALREQVTTLEEDLSQLQIELQLEVTRFYCKEAEATEALENNEQIETLNAAQAQVEQLTQEIQNSQQTIQHQQVEIETLTLKLADSQQRIAQLERDCALSQQRYKEQLQLVSQAEDTCQDLRMRLHRQQQQTLQFKAALEKSIEMNTVLETMQSEATSASPELGNHGNTDAAAFIPKAKPVQPWSTAPGMASPNHASAKHGSGLPNLLAKLSKQAPLVNPATPANEPELAVPTVETEALHLPQEPVQPAPLIDEASKNILEFLFPTQPSSALTDAHTAPPAQDAIFDLSPFIEAGEVDSEVISVGQDTEPVEAVVYQPEPAAATPPPEPIQPKDMLWADLARLIEPDLPLEEVAAEAHPFGNAEGISIQPPPQNVEHPEEKVVEFLNPIDLVAFSPEQGTTNEAPVPAKMPTITHNPFPSFTLRPTNSADTESSAAIDASVGTSETSAHAVVSSFPSPILYPTRQPKKIPSMAAVDLPSFPRG